MTTIQQVPLSSASPSVSGDSLALFGRTLVSGTVAATFFMLAGPAIAQPMPQVHYLGFQSPVQSGINPETATVSTPVFDSSGSASKSAAEEIHQLREQTALSIEQLGKLFDVSRRTVHLWLTGNQMNEKNRERLEYLTEFVRDLNLTDPTDVKNALLDSSNGPSRYRVLLSELRGSITQASSLSAAESLGG